MRLKICWINVQLRQSGLFIPQLEKCQLRENLIRTFFFQITTVILCLFKILYVEIKDLITL
jgi:hypothetical protein